MNTKIQILKSLQYIEQNLENNITISEIANAAGYSKAYFSRYFRAEMQMSVMEYVKKRRLIKASDAILNGEKIIDAALQFCWQTPSGFTKAFKKEFSFSPALLKAMMMHIEDLGGNSMSHVFMKATDFHASHEELFLRLKSELENSGAKIKTGELESIYSCACQIYAGKLRYSGDEYITHPLNVAILLAEMNADINTVYAGMFCDALNKTAVIPEQLQQILPAKAAAIAEKASEIPCAFETAEEEVILVKLAERLHNMRTLKFMDKQKQEQKARETLEQIMPLARKMGNSRLANELNDLALKYLCGE